MVSRPIGQLSQIKYRWDINDTKGIFLKYLKYLHYLINLMNLKNLKNSVNFIFTKNSL